jgi:hypothetical protein
MGGFWTDIQVKLREELVGKAVWLILGLVGFIASWLWGWFAAGGLPGLIGSLPPGAVVVLNRSVLERPCPDGWERFEAADGRVLVGAGGKSGMGVETYPPFKDGDSKAVGGADRVPIRLPARLPEDPRRVSDVEWGRTPWAPGPNPARGGAEITSAGEIDVRQPYVALFFCTKSKLIP